MCKDRKQHGNSGVRQGDILLPTLFALFINLAIQMKLLRKGIQINTVVTQIIDA